MTTPGPSVSGQPTPEPKIAELKEHIRDGEARFRKHRLAARDALRERINRAFLDEAATWEHTFPEGNKGEVIGVPDAALIAAVIAEQHTADLAAENARLRQERNEARSDLAHARSAGESYRRQRDSLREERDRLVAEVRRVADEWDAHTDHVDWDAVNVVERFVADLRAALAATAPQPAPAEGKITVLSPNATYVREGDEERLPYRVTGWIADDEDGLFTLEMEQRGEPVAADPAVVRVPDEARDECCGDCAPGLCYVDEIFDALTAAGWSLLPPGGQTRQIWRCYDLISGGSYTTYDGEELERHCRNVGAHKSDPLGPPPHPWQHQTAQRTVWPDGREHTTPWQEAPSE